MTTPDKIKWGQPLRETAQETADTVNDLIDDYNEYTNNNTETVSQLTERIQTSEQDIDDIKQNVNTIPYVAGEITTSSIVDTKTSNILSVETIKLDEVPELLDFNESIEPQNAVTLSQTEIRVYTNYILQVYTSYEFDKNNIKYYLAKVSFSSQILKKLDITKKLLYSIIPNIFGNKDIILNNGAKISFLNWSSIYEYPFPVTVQILNQWGEYNLGGTIINSTGTVYTSGNSFSIHINSDIPDDVSYNAKANIAGEVLVKVIYTPPESE